MKKLMPIALVLALIFAMSSTAWATTVTFQDQDWTDAGSDSIEATAPVNISVTKEEAETVYYVTIKWKDLDFEYTYTPEWDPENLIYKYEKGSWNSNIITNGVTVTNRSNAGVTCEFSVETNSAYSPCELEVGEGTATLDSAVEGSEPPEASVDLSISGTPSSDLIGQGLTQIGTVTVTISK